MGISPEHLFQILQSNNIDFFTGVPDSLLKQLCLCIDDNVAARGHIITANEGNAIGLAAGYHLSTGKVPLVYMQNSGLGNAINPLLSLCDREVYSIPMLMIIGWRGEPGKIDEPQHIKQGAIQMKLLNSIDIPFDIIDESDDSYESKIENGVKIARDQNRPYALIIKRGTFDKYKKKLITAETDGILREEALDIILNSVPNDSIVISTTGKTSREIFEIREKYGQTHEKDFLTVGSMGHCSSIALGVAISNTERRVICIDGDGALIMHMGSMATIGKMSPHNFIHILINNKVHESVGGQKTASENIDYQLLAKATNYFKSYSVESKIDLVNVIKDVFKQTGPSFIEINVNPGSRSDLGRPTIKPIDNKLHFMQYVQSKNK